jgi:hypothetical protein
MVTPPMHVPPARPNAQLIKTARSNITTALLSVIVTGFSGILCVQVCLLRHIMYAITATTSTPITAPIIAPIGFFDLADDGDY